MARLHTFKQGIRSLGVAESFDPRRDTESVVAGVVMRKDLVIDGVGLSKATVGGDDATEAVLKLYRSFKRNDINIMMLSGAIISYYNIVDLEALHKRTGRPLICLTFRESGGIEDSIRKRFPAGAIGKIERYRRLGERKRLLLKTGKTVFVRCLGTTDDDAKRIIGDFLLQGRYPEPVRVASLLAAAVRRVNQAERSRSRATS
jgi:endonuclease V-like protein UPF0215 family